MKQRFIARSGAAGSSPAVGFRRYLFLTAAVGGAAVMIVEILGARMLAPYVGTSHFVWTAQIAVTLVALAVGYAVGGRLADHSVGPGRMFAAMIAAAVFLAAAVPLCEKVCYGVLEAGLVVGSLAASAFLFFVPLALLAMVGPFAVRGLSPDSATVGGTVGRLTAVSTIGSFAGTVLISYVVIPYLPHSIAMAGTAALLALTGVGYFLLFGNRRIAAVGGSVVLLLLFATTWLDLRRQEEAGRALGEVYRGSSSFGLVQVLDLPSGNGRFLLNDFLIQNVYDRQRRESPVMFTWMLYALARAYTPAIREVLCIGLGVGIVPGQFAAEGARVTVVEINPKMAAVAERYFDCDPTRLAITIGDGRQFLNRCGRQYDAVILDAFLGESAPAHLLTVEAFRAMARVLRPGGVLVVNSFGSFSPGRDFCATSLQRTLQTVFPAVRIHANGDGSIFFVAGLTGTLAVIRVPELDRMPSAVRRQVQEAFDGQWRAEPAQGMVLTDDYNPVEFYDAANRMELRRRLALAMTLK